MNVLYQSAFLKALGWSLLNSLWQMGLLWLVYVGLTLNGKKLLSRQRHTLALLSLAGGSCWFLATLVIQCYKAASAPQVITVIAPNVQVSNPVFPWPATFNAWFEPVLPYLSLAYLCTAAFLFIRFYFHYRRTWQLLTAGLQKAPPQWRVYFQRTAALLGIKKKTHIWLSSIVDTPLTLGFLKPVILLPVAAVNHLTLKQAEAIILHELNHIKRYDYLVNLLIACVDVILFFNPFARLLTGIIRQERENCCDDMVLQFEYDAQAYVRALLLLEQNRVTSNVLTVAATGKNKPFLLNRVKRILGNAPVNNRPSQKLMAWLLCSLLIGCIGLFNPGNIIVRKMHVAPIQTASIETGQTFSTPITLVKMMPPDVAIGKTEQPGKNKAETACSDTDTYQKLQQLIELSTDAKLAALAAQADKISGQTIDFATNTVEEKQDYSLPQNNTAMAAPPTPDAYPYVPGNSFFYQALEDTAVPKKYIMTDGDRKAKEAMEKTLMALKQLNWNELEKELKAQGKDIDITQLQRHLVQAMRMVDWKKINDEAKATINQAQEDMDRAQSDYVIQLGNYQRDRALKLEKLKLVQQQILLDRMQQTEELKKMQEERKLEEARKKTGTTTVRKGKRIIQI